MEKVSIQDLSVVLIERSGLKKKDADTFVTAIFDLIKEGLAQDRLVKVKGLGTFKIIEIEPRESVNVNTGERVLIEGHSKLTFTPDTTLKELVNKPFSQFDTVVLNEGVVFDDLNEQRVSDADSELVQDSTIEPEPNSVPQSEPEPEPVNEPEHVLQPEPEPEPIHEPEPEPELVIEKLPEVQEKMVDALNEKINEKPEYMTKRQTWIGLCLAVLACILSFFAGYFVGDSMNSSVSENAIPTQDDVVAKDSVSVENNDIEAESSHHGPDSVGIMEASDTVVTPPAPKASSDSVVTEDVVSPQTYEKMDARVRTGAYRIVGTAYEEKVRAGDNLQKISRRTLGPGMECYVEVYNGMKASTVLTEGQTIKIPKLSMKKNKK